METIPALRSRVISLTSMNDVPAKTSTSRFSATRPSNTNSRLSRRKQKRVSPMTWIGEDPSA